MFMSLNRQRVRRKAGFTLIEVLIAVLISTVALLGLAKMQALAISSTKESGSRALIAMQAGSLAGMMQANPVFWGSGTVQNFSIDNGAITDGANGLNATVAGRCATTACTPAQMAAVDVQDWAANMALQFPQYTVNVVCPAALPVNCAIYMGWIEKQVAINKSTATGAATQVTTQHFSIYVRP